jgi:hypothetical protein
LTSSRSRPPADSAEDRPHLVVAAAARDGVARASRIGSEAGAAVVGVAAGIGEIEADAKIRMCFAGMRRQRAQVLQGSPDEGTCRQDTAGLVQHPLVAIEVDERRQRLPCVGREVASQAAEFGAVLGREGGVHGIESLCIDRHAGEHAAHDAGIGKVEDQLLDTGTAQALEGQILDLQIGLQTRVTVDLGPELQRLARRPAASGAGVQHRPAIAEADDTAAIQHVGVDACGLRRAVGAQPERPAAQLIDELESLQIERVTGARQQRLDVLEHRRDHQLEAETAGGIEEAAAQGFDLARPRR